MNHQNKATMKRWFKEKHKTIININIFHTNIHSFLFISLNTKTSTSEAQACRKRPCCSPGCSFTRRLYAPCLCLFWYLKSIIPVPLPRFEGIVRDELVEIYWHPPRVCSIDATVTFLGLRNWFRAYYEATITNVYCLNPFN